MRFILNDKEVSTALPAGTTVLDFVRYHEHLTGTKFGCREGDCRACTILVGSIRNDELHYESMTSCLMPLANANGKHIVTIEGINFPDRLNPVQQAMAEEGATQCGFCTPGFAMSLAGFCLNSKPATAEHAIAAVDGNICRCTGYKSIERAAARLASQVKGKETNDPAVFVAEKNVLPSYFSAIKKRLQNLNGQMSIVANSAGPFVGGGTDLYVQRFEEMIHADNRYLFDDNSRNLIVQEEDRCIMSAAVTVTDLLNSSFFNRMFPDFPAHAKLVSSTPIRNMATIAGNFVNASPIGDLTIFFLALDGQLVLEKDGKTREIPLRKFYKGYKKLDLMPGEFVSSIWFRIPPAGSLFNFEKVSKRTHLDIASVNAALSLTMNGNEIAEAGISAGGVAPIPLYLERASQFLKGKKFSKELVLEVVEIAKTEISPISDARGSKEYKTLLLGQLIKALFLKFKDGQASTGSA